MSQRGRELRPQLSEDLAFTYKIERMQPTNITTAVPLLVILVVALVLDLRTHRIPNALSLGGAMLGLVSQATLFGASGILVAGSGAAACLICFIPFYIGGGMAAGDVKLMAAVGAFLGPVGGLVASVFTMVAGAAIAAGWMAWLRAFPMFNGGVSSDDELARSFGSRIPYASAIALGTVAALLYPDFLSVVIRNGGLG